MKRYEMIELMKKTIEVHKSATPEMVAMILLAKMEQKGMSMHRYISSGCLHAMYESCNCQGTYEFGFEGEK